MAPLGYLLEHLALSDDHQAARGHLKTVIQISCDQLDRVHAEGIGSGLGCFNPEVVQGPGNLIPPYLTVGHQHHGLSLINPPLEFRL